ncbi:MAG: GNAT family N-acetyltransferase [Clostridiales bacterium]|nr:GNAT family N-acetyltransferase [Clostridiales bacterium]
MQQLKMYRPDLPVPDYTLPEGYTIRAMEPGEEVLWSVACLDAFVPSVDPIWYAKHMNRGVQTENVLLLFHGDECIGTATAQNLPDGPYLHFVAIRSAYRGRGLSRPLCLAVLKRHAELGHHGCYLTTDDFRLPAIALYLKLGFEPVLWTDDAEERWEKVYQALDDSTRPASILCSG